MRHAASALALIAGLGMAGSAQAAGWNGFYIGANINYGDGDASQPYSAAVGGPFVFTEADADQKGWIGGVQFGDSWMLGSHWVTGFEGTWDYSNVRGDDGGAWSGGSTGGDVNEVAGNWEAAVLWRLGVLVTPKTQLYGLGGYGWYNADISVTNAPQESQQETFTGWTWGLGLERECSPTMSWRIQYRTTSYDQERVSFPVNGYDIGVEPKISEIGVGISWRL
jgi:opacity protein-like surface antigen